MSKVVTLKKTSKGHLCCHYQLEQSLHRANGRHWEMELEKIGSWNTS
uniref:Uncharacterized protein n=1 Tax=Anguilla anguilla TaxID=7936 RepID=A0A0E9Q2R6_ANGAN